MQRQIRLDIIEWEKILKRAGVLYWSESLQETHIEPGELVITVVSEDDKSSKLKEQVIITITRDDAKDHLETAGYKTNEHNIDQFMEAAESIFNTEGGEWASKANLFSIVIDSREYWDE